MCNSDPTVFSFKLVVLEVVMLVVLLLLLLVVVVVVVVVVIIAAARGEVADERTVNIMTMPLNTYR